ncbi:MAG: DNA polymerase-4 [Myxococcota bacterium]|jgi:DNA polymerase-4
MDKTSQPWERIIIHADMDAFYAAIEQLDRPELRGQPIIIGGGSDRGVVLTASYEARPFGVGSAMPMARAKRQCPEAIVVAPRFARYEEVSSQIMAVFADFSPKVEPLSLDEAFLDMSGATKLFGDPETMGQKVKDAVFEATGGLHVSVGVSGCKYVAKVASDFDKPNGLTVVPPNEMRSFLAPLPVRRLWGAGAKTAAKLEAKGYTTIGQIARAPEHVLRAKFGSSGPHFRRLALADDPRVVSTGRDAQSIGSEQTLERDIRDLDEIKRHLRSSADRVAKRLRKSGVLAGGVRVRLKTRNFRSMTRQRKLTTPTCVAKALYENALTLLPHFDCSDSFRLVGLAAFDLALQVPFQLDLMGEPAAQRSLEEAMDAVDARFGDGLVKRAETLLHSDRFETPDMDAISRVASAPV